MPTIPAIEAALIARLSTLSELTGYHFLPDSFTVPCAIAAVGAVDHETEYGVGVSEYDGSILVIVARTDTESGQTAIDNYRSSGNASSIPDLLKADKTLGGVVATSGRLKSSPHVAITINGVAYIAAEFNLSIYA